MLPLEHSAILLTCVKPDLVKKNNFWSFRDCTYILLISRVLETIWGTWTYILLFSRVVRTIWGTWTYILLFSRVLKTI